MLTHLWLHVGADRQNKPVEVDRPWNHNVRSEIFCKNQEERDYLQSLNLMHGREIKVWIYAEWFELRESSRRNTNYKPIKVLPYAYSTYAINLRGM